ncbi:MAG TPA: hypothetical protein VGB99_18930 [Acidobacteriota bacterium]
MTQGQTLKQLQRAHWRTLESLVKQSYQSGFEAGLARAHGQSRRGRTVRSDATVEGLVRIISTHFGLERYGFEVRIVHAGSGRRVPAADQLRKYLLEK